jgi:membrane-associated phospholipid phosphatase
VRAALSVGTAQLLCFGSFLPLKDEGLVVRRARVLLYSCLPASCSRDAAFTQGALKSAIHRARPSELASSFAFPSGHTSLAAFLWGAALLVLLPRAAPAFAAVTQRAGISAPHLAAAVTLATAACRVAADVHWLSDTAAGAALGASLALATAAATQTWDAAEEEQEAR